MLFSTDVILICSKSVYGVLLLLFILTHLNFPHCADMMCMCEIALMSEVSQTALEVGGDTNHTGHVRMPRKRFVESSLERSYAGHSLRTIASHSLSTPFHTRPPLTHHFEMVWWSVFTFSHVPFACSSPLHPFRQSHIFCTFPYTMVFLFDPFIKLSIILIFMFIHDVPLCCFPHRVDSQVARSRIWTLSKVCACTWLVECVHRRFDLLFEMLMRVHWARRLLNGINVCGSAQKEDRSGCNYCMTTMRGFCFYLCATK